MRSRPVPRTFASGELAPWIDGITNELTGKGCRTLENFIVKKQGQAVRRPGTFFVAEVKDSSKATILVPVVIDDDNRYQLEIGDAYIRVYNQSTHAYLSTEIVSPWSAGELATLAGQYIPNKKAILFVQNVHAPQLLTWTSSTSWALNEFPIENYDKDIYVSVDGRVYYHDSFSTSSDPDPSKRIAFDYASSPRTYVLYGNGKYAALNRGQTGYTGTYGSYVSEDTENWVGTSLPFDPPSAFSKWAHMNSDGVGMFCGGSTGEIGITWDGGVTWTAAQGPSAKSFAVVGYDEIYRRWRIEATSVGMYTNDDGLSWTVGGGSLATGSTTPQWIDGYNDKWVVGVGTMLATASSTGSWTNTFSVTGVTFLAGTHGVKNGSVLWVAYARTSGGSTTIYVSHDNASTWSVAASYDARYTGGIGAQLNTFFCFDGRKFFTHLYNATVPGIDRISSDDGSTWTAEQVSSDSNRIDCQTTSWDGKTSVFTTSGTFPAVVASHEGRIVLGAGKNEQSTLRGSMVGNVNRFLIGNTSDKSWEYEITGQNNVDIQWIMGGQGAMVVGTRTAEGILLGSPDEGVTPLTAQFRWLSTFGSSNVRPVRVHDTIVFVQRGGEIIRGYVPAQQAYQSPELTAYADHIAEGGVTELDHQDDPQSMVYAVRSDGQLLALTFDNGMRAWSRIKMAASSAGAAVVESVAVIPTSGAEDEIWLIVKRTIGGSTKRYIEYMDTLSPASYQAAHYLDCGVYTTSAVSMGTVGSLTHIAGELVDAFISAPSSSIRWISGLTVAASGTIALSPYSGTAIHVGLPYSSYLQTLRSDYGSPWGAGAGLEKTTTALILWVHESSALAKFGPTTTAAVESITYSSSTTLVTESINYPFPGQYDRDNYIWCIVNDPRPFTLVGMIPDTETSDH